MRTRPSRVPFIFAAVLGSFFVYCVQSATQGSNPTASADCSAPATPPAFTELADGLATTMVETTNPIDVSAYREVIVQIARKADGCSDMTTVPAFRQTDDEAWGTTGQAALEGSYDRPPPGGRVRVDGPQMQLTFSGCTANHVPVHATWRVVGVK